MGKSVVKKVCKWIMLVVFSVVLLLGLGVGVVLNIVFTPAKLTPIVEKTAQSYFNAEVHFEAIELTFFSTFPNFRLELKEGSVVTRVFQDSLAAGVNYTAKDSLLTFQRCRMTLNPIAYLLQGDIEVKELLLERPAIYAYVDEEGSLGWNIAQGELEEEQGQVADTTTSMMVKNVEIKNIRVSDGNLIFDDRANLLYAQVEDLDFGISGAFARRKSDLKLDIRIGNLLVWQQGNLLVNKIALGVNTNMRVNRDSLLYVLDQAIVDVNGLKFGLGGCLRADTLQQQLEVDMGFGMDIPSLKTVLDLIPTSLVQRDQKVKVEGGVSCIGTVKGKYGKKRVPVVTFAFKVNGGKIKYVDKPYALEKLDLDLVGVVDLQKKQPSYLKLNQFYLKGAATELNLQAEIKELLSSPRFISMIKAKVNFQDIAQIFPLGEGITLGGELDAALKTNVLLADLKAANYGKLDVEGGCQLKNVVLESKRDSFIFESKSVGLGFGVNTIDTTIVQGKNLLNGIFGFEQVHVAIKDRVSFQMDTSYVSLKTSPLRDTSMVASVSANVQFGRINLNVGDSLVLRMGNSKVRLGLKPSKKNQQLPVMTAAVNMDSLRVRVHGNYLWMQQAGFDLTSVRVKDSLRKWQTSGVVGFKDLGIYTPTFPLRMRMPGTKISLVPGHIKLNGAMLQLGNSDMLLTGVIYNLADVFLNHGVLKAELALKSNCIDCNQLIKALEQGEANRKQEGLKSEYGDEWQEQELVVVDSVYEADSTTSVFVVPPRVDFTFKTDIAKVLYGKLELDSIYGEVFMRDQMIELSELSMRSMAADVKTTMLYKASSSQEAYAGFDLRMEDIHVASLIGFMPALDTLFPMLRSFEGIVNFHMGAETYLDSTMMIKLPTLRAAAYIDGRDLVLMDGETFAEISKMLMFKNKKRNMIDSVSVDFMIKDGMIDIFPFMIEMDRYKVAVGGQHNIDMTFKYHISLLKSPIPFRAGMDISGSLDKMKFRITKAKYKDIFIPSKRRKVDSAQLNLREQIRQTLQAVRK